MHEILPHIVTEQQSDPHHCYCFKIQKFDRDMEKQLLNDGFAIPLLELPRGQMYSFKKKINEHTQIHIKIMPNGVIEVENEYPSSYPIEHLDSTYCYSGHKEIEKILNYYQIPYTRKSDIPITCIDRIIIKSKNPIHYSEIALALSVVALITVIAVLMIKSK